MYQFKKKAKMERQQFEFIYINFKGLLVDKNMQNIFPFLFFKNKNSALNVSRFALENNIENRNHFRNVLKYSKDYNYIYDSIFLFTSLTHSCYKIIEEEHIIFSVEKLIFFVLIFSNSKDDSYSFVHLN